MLRLQLMLLLVCIFILHLCIWLNHLLLLLLLVASLRWHLLLMLYLLLLMWYLLLMDMSSSRRWWIHACRLTGSRLLHVLLLHLLLLWHHCRRSHLLLWHGIHWGYLLILLLLLLMMLLLLGGNGRRCLLSTSYCSSYCGLWHDLPIKSRMADTGRSSKNVGCQKSLIDILQARATLEGILIAYGAAAA